MHTRIQATNMTVPVRTTPRAKLLSPAGNLALTERKKKRVLNYGAQEEEGSQLCDNSHGSSHSSDWSHVSPGRYAVPFNISCVQPLGGCKATPQVRTLCVNFRMLGEWMDFSILWTDGLEAVL